MHSTLLGQKGGNWTLNAPRGLVVDEAGVIYIVNRAHSNVKAFDASFNLLMKTAENDDSGTSGGKMLEPLNIWYHNNLLYVTDKEAPLKLFLKFCITRIVVL
jgi:DNA-binding beta-propeller fold protein YncE